MQFGKLRSSIRKYKGTVSLRCEICPGVFADVPIQKTPFIREVLPTAFCTEDQTWPTGMTFEDGVILSIDREAPIAFKAATEAADDLDLDLTDEDEAGSDDLDLDLSSDDDDLDLDLGADEDDLDLDLAA